MYLSEEKRQKEALARIPRVGEDVDLQTISVRHNWNGETVRKKIEIVQKLFQVDRGDAILFLLKCAHRMMPAE